MPSFLIAIFASLLGFGAGSVILNNINYQPSINQPLQKQVQAQQTDTFGVKACYSPDPNVFITLKWPQDFQNVPDQRKTLNPSYFGKLPSNFNTTTDCKSLAMNNKSERNFILVRKNVRIASCKTDELAGPLGLGVCPGTRRRDPAAVRNRGSCTISGYTDLRKVAEVQQAGQNLEIFWEPFSYNVGCNYKQDENCGPGDRRNINLKDFIYVLKRRDAFSPDYSPGCPVLWDAGSVNAAACSHYFDVYLAEDVYLEMQTAPAAVNPDHPLYFLKQVVENCQEQTTFIPVAAPNIGVPPNFISTPFIGQNEGIIVGGLGKIYPDPANPIEKTNYLAYVWGRPDIFQISRTNLLKASENPGPPLVCPPNQPSSPNCYDPIGSINFKDQTSSQIRQFRVYTSHAGPQTFTLVETADLSKLHIYVATDKLYPEIQQHDPSLQLGRLEVLAQNEWSWATPWCKPALYFYPEKETELNVKLEVEGKLTVSDPPYDENEGWNVIAYPDGTLRPVTITSSSNNSPLPPLTLRGRQGALPYLYYEADVTGVTIPKEGWVIEKSNIKNQISKIMSDIGFNQKEIEDFLNYWLPRLTDKPYYFVTLLPENQINNKEKLILSNPTTENRQLKTVSPDTLIRVRVVFEGLDSPINIKPPTNIPHYQRKGFTVTDWGGTLIGESCEDVTIK